MQSRAVLDMVGFPAHAPGNLECRFQLATFDDLGKWIDDGSRSGKMQSMKHRIVLDAGKGSVGEQGAAISGHLRKMGYEPPDLRVVEVIAAREWRDDVIDARKARIAAGGINHRMAVRALGFDLYHSGELSLGLSKTTVGGGTAKMTAKASMLLLAGDPLWMVFDTLALSAHRLGYEPLCAEDIGLVQTVATDLWTPAAITARGAVWDAWHIETGVDIVVGQAIELGQRLVRPEFQPIPAGVADPIYLRESGN